MMAGALHLSQPHTEEPSETLFNAAAPLRRGVLCVAVGPIKSFCPLTSNNQTCNPRLIKDITVYSGNIRLGR